MAAIVMAGIVGWCLYMCAGIKPQTEAQFNAADNSMQALMDAQDHIKSMLKSPGSAKWPSLWGNDRPLNGVARLPDGTYMVTSFVDSQNGFGALVRTWFRVHIRVKQSGRPDILSAEFLGPQ